jgi:serine/threonine protein kinase
MSLVLKKSGTTTQLWFMNYSPLGFNDDCETVTMAVIKNCKFDGPASTARHANILERILGINDAAIDKSEDGPFAIYSCEVNLTSCLITYYMLKYQTSLETWMAESSKETIALEAGNLSLQLSSAMLKLHNANLIHLDLNPFNVLMNISPTLSIVIADFDTALNISPKESQPDFAQGTVFQKIYHGSPPYSAPEHLSQIVCKASDVWSFGCIVMRLCMGGEDHWPSDITMWSVYKRVYVSRESPYSATNVTKLRQAETFENGLNHTLLDLLRDGVFKYEHQLRVTFGDIVRQLTETRTCRAAWE